MSGYNGLKGRIDDEATNNGPVPWHYFVSEFFRLWHNFPFGQTGRKDSEYGFVNGEKSL
jgi:hypothetical protein